MTIKAVDLVRKIRESQYDKLKSFSREKQIEMVRKKAEILRAELTKHEMVKK